MAVRPRAGGGPPEFSLTVTDLLEVRAASYGSRVFALLPDTRSHLAFADLNANATRFANVLHALGLRAGDRVALLLANGREFLLTLFGALKLGAWVAVVDPGMGADGITGCLQRVRPKAVAAAGERRVAQAAAARDQGAWSGELVAFGLRSPRRRVLRGEHLLEAAPAVLYGEIAELLKERGAGGLITFTWHPPDLPLAVMLPETALAHVAASLTRRLGLGAGDRTVPLASLSHHQGMILTLLAMLYAGGTVVLAERAAPASLIEAYRATWLLAPPALLAAAAPGGPRSRASWRLSFVLAVPGPVDPALRRHLAERWGVPVLLGYGRPETTWVAACDAPGALLPSQTVESSGAGAVGRPLACRMAVAGKNGEVIEAARAAGEVLVRGDNLMRGYVDDPEATARVLRPDGWLRTGDRGLLTADGTLHVISRQAVA